jgi:hypothetical protein
MSHSTGPSSGIDYDVLYINTDPQQDDCKNFNVPLTRQGVLASTNLCDYSTSYTQVLGVTVTT